MADTSENLDNNLSGPITMRVDAPAEDSKPVIGDSEKIEHKSSKDEEFKMCSPFDRIPNTASINPFTQAKSSGGILKPPQLNVNTSSPSKSSFVLNPSRLNSFAARSGGSDKKVKSSQTNGETPKFVPLIQTETKTNNTQVSVTTSSTTVATNSFIFGQNLQDRVIAAETKTEEPKPSTSLNSNGTTEMLFSSAIKNEIKADSGGSSNKETKSLSESAREYEESRAVKRKYEEVEVLTGEEDETNILNITCKLFAFDKGPGSWQERGRGVLRLNDFERDNQEHSRLLFRTMGSFRVVLNTPIWAEMTVQQASEKSVRFTALDQQGAIKVFLATASIEDSKQLFSQIQTRVQREVIVQKHKKPNAESNTKSDKNKKVF